MLAAFGWKLPDSYWKNHCKMDLIFEYTDLQKTNCPVDWQFIGLATEELMEDPTWERKTGLGTRRWIFGQLRQMRTIFLDLVDQEKLNPGCLIEPARRKYPLKKSSFRHLNLIASRLYFCVFQSLFFIYINGPKRCRTGEGL